MCVYNICTKDLPATLTKRVQTELVGDLRDGHCTGQVLLVGEHQQRSSSQFILKGVGGWVNKEFASICVRIEVNGNLTHQHYMYNLLNIFNCVFTGVFIRFFFLCWLLNWPSKPCSQYQSPAIWKGNQFIFIKGWPRLTFDAARSGLQRSCLDRYYPPRRSALACSENSASTEVESASPRTNPM